MAEMAVAAAAEMAGGVGDVEAATIMEGVV